MEALDVLSVFKEHLQSKKPIYLDGENIVLSDRKFKKTTECQEYTKKDGKYFTIGQIWLYFKNYGKKMSEYVKSCKKYGMSTISKGEQKPLEQFFFPNGMESFVPDNFDKKGIKTKQKFEEPIGKKQKNSGLVEDTESKEEFINFIDAFTQYFDSLENDNEATNVPKFDYEKCSKFIENDKILIQDIKKREIKNSSFSTKNVKNGIFQSSLDTVLKIQREENIKNQSERKPTSTKGQFDEKTVWKTSLGGAELEELNIDTMGSNLLFSSSKTLFSSSADTQEVVKEKPKIQKKKIDFPIIIVPASVTSLISLYNVKGLLEKDTFVSTETLKTQGAQKERTVILKRKIKDKEQKFCVLDDPSKLSSNDWKRVIAIFTAGQSWQFKGWPIQNPTELFSKYKGFYLCFDDEKVKDVIRSWPIKIC
eukprot:gene11691-4925_t